MLLKECYDTFGGSYESVRQRISSDEIIKKFVIKFLSEPSYRNLCDNFEKGDYVEAFRAAHSLKGVAANLGFNRLQGSVSELTELLRNSEGIQIDTEACKGLLVRVTEDYKQVVEAIMKLEG